MPLRPPPILFASLLSFASIGGCSSAVPEEEAESASDEYSAASMPVEVNRRIARCFALDWSQVQMSERTDPSYEEMNVVFDGLGRMGLGMFHGIGYLVLADSQGEETLEKLEHDLRDTAATQNLADFQKAALVSCVSSHLISYAFNGLSKFLGPTKAAENYEGVCTEYAAISKRLLRALDLSAGLMLGYKNGGPHAWNWITLDSQDGATYWIEPQRDPVKAPGWMFFNRSGGRGAAEPTPTDCDRNKPDRTNATCVADERSCAGLRGTPSSRSCAGSPGTSVCCEMSTAPEKVCRYGKAGCTKNSDCCSNVCLGNYCSTACDAAAGANVCTIGAACASIGGQPSAESCAGATEGSTCCALPSAAE